MGTYVWPMRMAIWWKEPVAAHTMIMLSCDDDTTRLPSCEKLTAATPSLWPVSVPLSEPSADLEHFEIKPPISIHVVRVRWCVRVRVRVPCVRLP